MFQHGFLATTAAHSTTCGWGDWVSGTQELLFHLFDFSVNLKLFVKQMLI